MHRFNMGNDNPIRNEKLLREAYQAGRQQALNEQMGGGNEFVAGGIPTPGAARQLGSRAMADAMYGPDADVQNYSGYGPGPMERAARPFSSGRSGRRRNRRATQRLRRRMMGEQFGGGGTPPTFQRAPMDPMAYGTGETRGGNRMGMGTGREGRQELAAAGQIGPVPNPGNPPGTEGGPRTCPAPTLQKGGRHMWDEGRGTWVYYGPGGDLYGVYISPPGVWRLA